MPDYPKAEDFPNFKANYGPRGVLRCRANADGTQTIEDTGPLTKKRMETIDDEIVDGAVDFIERKNAEDAPFFLWVNTTHMHFRTHPKPESVGQAGRWQSEYHDTMIDHDRHVGRVLDKLDELGIAEDTIFIYSTDNGPHMNSWPDGAMTPFRSEKNTNWEGAFRVPEMIRWPGKIPAGVVSNEIISHMDWMPTLLAAAGDPDVKEKLLSATRRPARRSRSTSTATTSCRTSPARRTRARGSSSSTSATTATSSPPATTTGSWCSPSSGSPARSRSGRSRS